MDEPRNILLVEDNPHDVELTLTALTEHNITNQVVVVNNGADALDYLYCRGQYESRPPGDPAVLLLDLKMPKVDGLQVLRTLKQDPDFRRLPVVMLTSSREEQDLVQSYDLGVNSYVIKPVGFEDFLEAVRKLGIYWTLQNEPPPGRKEVNHGN